MPTVRGSVLKSLRCVAIALPLMPFAVRSAEAQEIAGTFDQLRVLVKSGDTITIVDDAGRETTGTVAELSPTSLGLLVRSQRRDLTASEINTIRQRRPDSLANGAKWGFGIGAGIGLLAGLAIASEYDEGDDSALVFFGALIYGGIGSGIGAGIDALMSTNQVIYARRAASARITVRPLIKPQRRAVVVAIGF